MCRFLLCYSRLWCSVAEQALLLRELNCLAASTPQNSLLEPHCESISCCKIAFVLQDVSYM